MAKNKGLASLLLLGGAGVAAYFLWKGMGAKSTVYKLKRTGGAVKLSDILIGDEINRVQSVFLWSADVGLFRAITPDTVIATGDYLMLDITGVFDLTGWVQEDPPGTPLGEIAYAVDAAWI